MFGKRRLQNSARWWPAKSSEAWPLFYVFSALYIISCLHVSSHCLITQEMHKATCLDPSYFVLLTVSVFILQIVQDIRWSIKYWCQVRLHHSNCLYCFHRFLVTSLALGLPYRLEISCTSWETLIITAGYARIFVTPLMMEWGANKR